MCSAVQRQGYREGASWCLTLFSTRIRVPVDFSTRMSPLPDSSDVLLICSTDIIVSVRESRESDLNIMPPTHVVKYYFILWVEGLGRFVIQH